MGITTADISGTFTLDIYEKSENGWCSLVDTLNLVYFSGSSLNFVASFTNGSYSSGSNFSTGLVQVVGELNSAQNALKNGYIVPLGAYSLGYDSGNLAAFKIDLKGKKASKLGCTN